MIILPDYREFISLTEEEIKFILTELFSPIKIENIFIDKEMDEINADIITEWITIDDDGNEVEAEYEDAVTLTSNNIHIDFSLNNNDLLKYKQWLLSKGIYNLLKNNPYLKRTDRYKKVK